MRARFLLSPERLFIWFLGAVWKPAVLFAAADAFEGWLLPRIRSGAGAEPRRSSPAAPHAAPQPGSAARPGSAAPRLCSFAPCRWHSGAAENTLSFPGTAVSGLGKASESLKWRLFEACKDQPLVLLTAEVSCGTLRQLLQRSQTGRLHSERSFPKLQCLGGMCVAGTGFSICSEMPGHFWNKNELL